MRAVVQRVTRAEVAVDGRVFSSIGNGLMVLLGVEAGDGDTDLAYIKQKLVNLRIFEDDDNKMNRSVLDIDGELMIVSQFTLLGDARKGRRPGFVDAEKPERANEIYTQLCDELDKDGMKIARGKFQTEMQISLINDGPVTILLDSRKVF